MGTGRGDEESAARVECISKQADRHVKDNGDIDSGDGPDLGDVGAQTGDCAGRDFYGSQVVHNRTVQLSKERCDAPSQGGYQVCAFFAHDGECGGSHPGEEVRLRFRKKYPVPESL